jgi:hypothetical protein
MELDFLGHISHCGIKVDISKVDKILQWPDPWNTTDVPSFLGCMQYISVCLLKLADFTNVLTHITKHRY